MISKSDAERIAHKLGACIKTGKKHRIAIVRHEGKIVARYGIRHASRKDTGHDFIPKELGITPRDTKRLSDCTLDRNSYFAILSSRGLL